MNGRAPSAGGGFRGLRARIPRVAAALRNLGRRLARVLLVLFLLQLAAVVLYRFVDPPLTPLMLWRLVQGHGLDHRPVALDDVPVHVRAALIASEDSRFCTHYGFDWVELRQQLVRLFHGEPARGASTLTMQTARNILLWPGRDPLRKLLEAFVALELELLWPKRRIFEVHLSVAEYGPGVYGIEAGARRWFGRPVSRLSPREAALLVSVLPAPLTRRPDRPDQALLRRARVVEARARALPAELLACVLDQSSSTTRSAASRPR